MNSETWHFILEISKILIAPMLGVLGWLLNGMKVSMKQLEHDISEIKTSISVHSNQMENNNKSIDELRNKINSIDKEIIQLWQK